MTKRKPRPDDDINTDEPTALMIPEADDPLYLPEGVEEEPVIVTLAPPDLNCCQCEWRDTSIETFGPKPIVRCEEEPTVVAFQKRAREDGTPTGCISLCDVHRTLFEHTFPGLLYYRRVTAEKRIGGFA